MLYKIGDFSKKVNTSIRTLRYYDEIELFKPIEIDLYTGYRYYSHEQIEQFEIIRQLADVGFSLDEIKQYDGHFDNHIMLEKKNQILGNIERDKQRIRKIDYLRSIIINGKFTTNPSKKSTNNKKKTLYQ